VRSVSHGGRFQCSQEIITLGHISDYVNSPLKLSINLLLQIVQRQIYIEIFHAGLTATFSLGLQKSLHFFLIIHKLVDFLLIVFLIESIQLGTFQISLNYSLFICISHQNTARSSHNFQKFIKLLHRIWLRPIFDDQIGGFVALVKLLFEEFAEHFEWDVVEIVVAFAELFFHSFDVFVENDGLGKSLLI